jgi:hypothetical protein
VLDLYQTLRSHALKDRTASGDSYSLVNCFTNTKDCGIRSPYSYSETYQLNEMAILQMGKVAVRYGHDKMVARYDADLQCMAAEFYETFTDPFETVPLAWPAGNMRSDRLRNHFTNLHASEPSSWATDPATGAPFLFCP